MLCCVLPSNLHIASGTDLLSAPRVQSAMRARARAWLYQQNVFLTLNPYKNDDISQASVWGVKTFCHDFHGNLSC